jgi:beta-lactamase regulating signal transducer with metallopeptidase domain
VADFWLQLAVSNLCVSGALAAIAYGVQRHGRHPLLAHLLWLLVLVKLVTPPVFTMPLIPVATSVPSESVLAAEGAGPSLAIATESAYALPDGAAGFAPSHASDALVLVWMLGSLVVAAWSLTRLVQFHRLLRRSSTPAPGSVRHLARDLAARMSLREAPAIDSSAASISPFVWWVGGRPRVVIPEHVLVQFPREELRMILAHELAHVRRRDHWVRWLEWFTCVASWWNPIAWWARRNIRINEELGCDMLVLETLNADRRNYANSLLSVAEFLSTEAIRPPSVVSAMNSGGKLEQRLTMIISNHLPKTPRWLLSAVVAIGASLLPLSVAYAQDFNAVERRLGSAVEAGEITLQQAQTMMEALRRAAHQGEGKQDPDLEAKKRRYLELERRVKAAVQEGKLSREDAEKKLIEARKDMFGQPGKEKLDQRALRQRYAEYQRRLDAAVKEGKLSREEAEKKLIEARKDMFGEPRDEGRDLEALKRRYLEYQRRLEAAVEKGELSREDAEKKLIEARKDMFGQPDEKKRDQRALRQRYAEYQRRLEAAVKEGELSREDAEKKLIEARKKMFGEQKAERAGRERIREER